MESEWVNKIQLIRNIERVAGEKMGEKNASEFFRELSSYGNFAEYAHGNFTENSHQTTTPISNESFRKLAFGKFIENSGQTTSKKLKENSQQTTSDLFWKEVLKLASGIVAEKEIGTFVKVMVQGRFENIPPL